MNNNAVSDFSVIEGTQTSGPMAVGGFVPANATINSPGVNETVEDIHCLVGEGAEAGHIVCPDGTLGDGTGDMETLEDIAVAREEPLGSAALHVCSVAELHQKLAVKASHEVCALGIISIPGPQGPRGLSGPPGHEEQLYNARVISSSAQRHLTISDDIVVIASNVQLRLQLPPVADLCTAHPGKTKLIQIWNTTPIDHVINVSGSETIAGITKSIPVKAYGSTKLIQVAGTWYAN